MTLRLFLKNLLFTLLVPGTVALWAPWRWVAPGDFHRPESWGLLQIFALPVLAAGVAIYLWCVWDFAVTGRGTPAPIDAPKVLVVKGLYRYVRNPMYVGVLLVLAGEALLFESQRLLVYLGAIALMFHCVVLLVEEPILSREFGAAYETYRRQVWRWWPRRPRS
jgi:protein-S-isoprenylcysteine O-methyltransferase Ste14